MIKMDEFCNPKKSILYNRSKFYGRNQNVSEPFDLYLMDIQFLAKACEFKEIEEMVRDRIVFGIQDRNLQEKLITSENIKYEKVVEICRAYEVNKKSAEEIQENKKAVCEVKNTINNVNKNKNGPKKFRCTYCLEYHEPRKCPAFGKLCENCLKYNHFTKACRLKKLRNIEKDETATDGNDHVYIEGVKIVDGIQKNEERFSKFENIIRKNRIGKDWIEKIEVENKTMYFKIDTGSEVNVLPKLALEYLKCNSPILKTSLILECFGGFKMKPIGKVELLITSSMHSAIQDFIIVENAGTQPIIGLKTAELLGFVKYCHINNVENKENHELFSRYSSVFNGLGVFPKECILTLKENAIPVIKPARRIPIKIKDKFKLKLELLEKDGIISRVYEPVDWINNLVIVEKPNKDLRLCLDPQELNNALKQEYFQIPTLEEITSDLNGMKYFTVLDLKDGFWQVKLSEDSSKLCSFNTMYGVYKFNRLPFGLNIAPQLFQRMNVDNFGDIPGVHIYIDDLLISAKTEEEHDFILEKVMKRAMQLNVKFNKSKVQYKLQEVKYLGHIFNVDGIKPDPDRIKSIQNMKIPTNKKELQALLGMINYLRSFTPDMSELTSPLRMLLKKNSEWSWSESHTKCLEILKSKLSSIPILAIFDDKKQVTIQTDSSKHGIGSCLLQEGKPICYASRSLTDTEQRYAQIEKELLAIVFACKKFHHYIYGRKIQIQSDHLPLIPLLKKDISKSQASRIQRMRMKLMIYDFKVHHVPGKEMHVADFLSRFVDNDDAEVEELDEIIHTINMSEEKQSRFIEETKKDPVLSKIKGFYLKGWPNILEKISELKHYEKMKNEIFCENDLIFMGDRLIIPTSMRKFMLNKLHEGHFGINRTKDRAKELCYWPRMNNDIENFITDCSQCETYRSSNVKEPIINHEIPILPFHKIGCDIFQWKGKNFLILQDYLSKWLEIIPIKNKNSEEIMHQFEKIFSIHGIPAYVIADNMPFNSYQMKNFANEWNFKIITSSPHYPKSNGLAERAVQTAKRILNKNQEFQKALLEYRNTPLPGIGLSPAQILMSRRTRTFLPIRNELLFPKINQNVKEAFDERNKKNEKWYNKSARAREEFEEGENVLFQNDGLWENATVIKKLNEPRSYIIRTSSGQILRRNSCVLRKKNNKIKDGQSRETKNNDGVERNVEISSEVELQNVERGIERERTSRFGRVLKPVNHYIPT